MYYNVAHKIFNSKYIYIDKLCILRILSRMSSNNYAHFNTSSATLHEKSLVPNQYIPLVGSISLGQFAYEDFHNMIHVL